MNNHLQRLRLVGYCEGVSFLVLLGIAMPLKYMAGMPAAVLVAGWIHGVLFILYVISAVQAYSALRWPPKRLGGALAAAVLPFGPFVFDWWLRRVDLPAKHQPLDHPSDQANVD